MSWIFASVGIFLIAALIHAAARRLFPTQNSVLLFLSLAFACGVGGGLLLRASPGFTRFSLISALCVYCFLTELYLFAFTFVFGSVSAWLLVAVQKGTFNGQLDSNRNPEIMLHRRIEGLRFSGLIVVKNDSLSLTAKGRAAAFASNALRSFFTHQSSAGRHKG